MSGSFGRTESIPPKEWSSRRELAKEKFRTEELLAQAHRFASLIADPEWQHYRDYMVKEVLRPAENACRTLNPFKDQEELLRNQVIVKVIRQIIEEPQMRSQSTLIDKLQEKLNLLMARIRATTK